ERGCKRRGAGDGSYEARERQDCGDLGYEPPPRVAMVVVVAVVLDCWGGRLACALELVEEPVDVVFGVAPGCDLERVGGGGGVGDTPAGFEFADDRVEQVVDAIAVIPTPERRAQGRVSELLGRHRATVSLASANPAVGP